MGQAKAPKNGWPLPDLHRPWKRWPSNEAHVWRRSSVPSPALARLVGKGRAVTPGVEPGHVVVS